jgi:hypothetical protein
MTHRTRARITNGGGLLEAAAVALAGLTVVGALIQSGDAAGCVAPVRAGFEQRVTPAERPLDTDAIRDMRLHD